MATIKSGFFDSTYGERTYSYNGKTILTGDRGYLMSDLGRLPFFLINEGIVKYGDEFELSVRTTEGTDTRYVYLTVGSGKYWFNGSHVNAPIKDFVGGYYIKSDTSDIHIYQYKKNISNTYITVVIPYLILSPAVSGAQRTCRLGLWQKSVNSSTTVIPDIPTVYDFYSDMYYNNAPNGVYVVPLGRLMYGRRYAGGQGIFQILTLDDYRGKNNEDLGTASDGHRFRVHCPFASLAVDQ